MCSSAPRTSATEGIMMPRVTFKKAVGSSNLLSLYLGCSVMFIEHLPHAKHCSKYYTGNIAFDLQYYSSMLPCVNSDLIVETD